MSHNQIDLHIHSNISNDGEFSPTQLVEACAQNGLKIISITDHNSVRGISVAQKAIKNNALDLLIIPALELDCQYNGLNLHILGYGIDMREAWFTSYEQFLNDQERKTSLLRVAKIRDLGIHLISEELDKISIEGIVTGEMIAEVALKDNQNNDNPDLAPYRKRGNRADNPLVNFYWDFCAQGKPAYVEIELVTAKEAISKIKDAGGLAVLAHPGNNIGMNDALLKQILQCGLDGIEVYSSYHSAEMIRFYRQKALDNHVLMTLGSDYHGKTKPSIKLGTFDCPDEQLITQSFLRHLNIAFDEKLNGYCEE